MFIKTILKYFIFDKEIRLMLSELLTKKINDKFMIVFLYYLATSKLLKLNNPKTYNEKIQWYKLYYRDPLMVECADKYLVRSYVEKCGLGKILTPIYNCYDDTKKIKFELLPDECFLKCNHNSNGNILWQKNKKMDIDKIKKRLARMLKTNAFYSSREWAYKDVKPVIICEEYLKTHSKEGLVDYNFFCFNGEPKLVLFNVGLCDENGNHSVGERLAMDLKCNLLDIETALPKYKGKFVVPNNFSDMVEYSKILSKPFPHVRVDFFYVDGSIKFGEMTFYSAGGFGKFRPEKWEKQLGDWFVLPNKRI